MASSNEPDDDNPEWTAQDFARARPADQVHSPEIVSQLVRAPGRPVLPEGRRKERITIRLAPEIVRHFRATGRGWQGRMEDALRAVLPHK